MKDLEGDWRVERREGRIALVYCPPFSAIVDELWSGAEGSGGPHSAGVNSGDS